MDLKKLEHAVGLAEAGNYARAAKRLNITQPALSRSIQALEASLGVILFDRAGGGVRQTVEGATLLARARTMLSLSADMRREAAQLSGGESGSVIFGIGPMLTPLLGSILCKVLERSPKLSVRVEISPAQKLAELLDAERVEFFVADTSHAVRHPDFQIEDIAELPAGCYVRKAHPLAKRKRDLSAEALAAWPLATLDIGQIPAKFGLDRRPRVSCEDIGTLKQVGLNTDAVLLGLGLSFEPELSRGELVFLEDSPFGSASHIGIVSNARRTPSTIAKRVMEELRVGIASF